MIREPDKDFSILFGKVLSRQERRTDTIGSLTQISGKVSRREAIQPLQVCFHMQGRNAKFPGRRGFSRPKIRRSASTEFLYCNSNPDSKCQVTNRFAARMVGLK